ncbi:penicillin-binding protein [Methylovorus sp. MM2]|uniref:penicillin-binding protein 1A n=1 Tax=Methylovorus sp. MM2 TaxID=1848038 RepID=UPI0007DF1372|nr:penicillin-binding protein 1A [Methylovorus sp. MM2]OAM52178.1 penicillin-binding protein [Methylovorus sp. MM2]
MFPKKWWQFLILITIVFGLVVAALVGLAATLIYPELPSLEVLTDYRPKVPLRVYSEDGYLLGEFGEERRAFTKIEDVPKNMQSAVLAIEDRRFYQHGGVDTRGILRAIVNNITGGGREGASTITMQVARNFFLSSERTFKRKINEALLAIKIEHSLSKDKILEVYINQIYLGQRAYGFAAASQVYFGKPLDKLSLAETAVLAGLPKAPSAYNPFVNPKRAIKRQREVLYNMYHYGFIDEPSYEAAVKEPLRFKASRQSRDLAADYVAELVRQEMYQRYQDNIYSSGLKVYTTILKSNQEAANAAILQGILDYDRRHGYRGPEKVVQASNTSTDHEVNWMDKALDDIEAFNGLIPAIVTKVGPKSVTVHSKSGENIEIEGDGLALVQKTLNEKDPEKRSIKFGAVVRIVKLTDSWRIAQLPQVESALVAVDPENGAVRALVGGFDFNRNKFNHVTQAWRQPGSSFKPFIYSAAIEKGYTPATIINDEPISLSAAETGSGSSWDPKNFDGKYEGPMRLRTALTKSKNMVSIRILQAIGVNYAQDYISRFGFSPKDHPPYLAMALGAGSATPWQMAGAYAIFANGGYRVKPYIIGKITDSQGHVIEQAKPLIAGKDAPRVIDGRNAFLMTSILQDVARIGTAAKARQIGRSDLAGKTGTTNNQIDAWFAGFNPKQVAVAWIGFDHPRSLGNNETGGQAALPIWISYMTPVLKGTPDNPYTVPEGVNSIKIDPVKGTHVEDNEAGIYEYFYHEFPPPEPDKSLLETISGFFSPSKEKDPQEPTKVDQLF